MVVAGGVGVDGQGEAGGGLLRRLGGGFCRVFGGLLGCWFFIYR